MKNTTHPPSVPSLEAESAPSSLENSLGQRIIDASMMFSVALISFFVLIYIAFSEARHNYENLQVEKLVAQGRIVENTLEGFTRSGVTLSQFPNFHSLAESIIESDQFVADVTLYNANNKLIFSTQKEKTEAWSQEKKTVKPLHDDSQLYLSTDKLQLAMPIRNRFEQVGLLVLTSQRDKISGLVEQAFYPLAKIALIASFVFAIYVFIFEQRSHSFMRTQSLTLIFSFHFLLVSTFVVYSLISVYSDGVKSRAQVLAGSLAARLDDVPNYGLSFTDFSGISTLTNEYKRLNPEIRAAVLVLANGRVGAHSGEDIPSGRWVSHPDDFEFSVPLGSPKKNVSQAQVIVSISKNIVYKNIFRSAKNFIALFVASAFMAALFMGVARSLNYVRNQTGYFDEQEQEKAKINLIKPVFFLAVFIENLNYAFLPQWMYAKAEFFHVASSYASLPFLAYYTAFALSLVPAGRLETRWGSRNLVLFGLMLAGLGIFMLSMEPNNPDYGFYEIVAARFLAGIGQGTLFIGVQSYIIANVAPQRKTQGGAAIVFGFQAGMIAGTAIGSLLFRYIDANGVFRLGASLAAVTIIYTFFVLMRSGGASSQKSTSTTDRKTSWWDYWLMVKDGDFIRSMLLIGVPAKAALTGIILFALPLLLSKDGFMQEDIGQITMVYAGAVILASSIVASYADATGDTEQILVIGGIFSALGFCIISLVGMGWVTEFSSIYPFLPMTIIISGVAIIGFAHGFVNAPVVTHVTESAVARNLGAAYVASTYRLVERGGHMLGPVLMGHIFLYFGASWKIIGIIGGVILLLTIFFPTNHSSHEDKEVKTN